MARKIGEQIILTPEEARQGHIVLRKRWQRAVFILGLIGAVIVVLALRHAMS